MATVELQPTKDRPGFQLPAAALHGLSHDALFFILADVLSPNTFLKAMTPSPAGDLCLVV